MSVIKKVKSKVGNKLLNSILDNDHLFKRLSINLINSKKYSEKFIEFSSTQQNSLEIFLDKLLSNPSFSQALIESYPPSDQMRVKNREQREIWLKDALKKLPAGSKILDAGAGELQYKKFCTHLNYVSQDFAQYDGVGTGEGKQQGTWDNSKLDIISDIIDIPVENSSFDAIMCIEVFEHIPQPALAVKEFARILKKGGTVIITAPFASITHFAPYFFANGYSKYWYQDILSANGFKSIEITPNGNYFDYISQELERLPEVAEQYTKEMPSGKEKILIEYLQRMLGRLSKKGNSSNELLNFGYHVKAVKK